MIETTIKNKRFDSLYLEDSECLTRELPATIIYCDSVNGRKVKEKGILYICSKSLVFEPKEAIYPILKIPFSSFEADVRVENGTSLQITANKLIEINTSGPPSSYSNFYIKDPNSKIFSLTLSEKSACQAAAAWIKSLRDLKELEHLIEDPLFHVTQLMIMQMERIEFDRRELESVNENFKITEEMLVQRVLPLTSTYGYLYLTDRNFYFMEILAQDSSSMVRIPIKLLKRILKRRFELKYTAIELETEDKSFYFNFKEQNLRDRFYENVIKNVQQTCVTEKSLSTLTNLWVSRKITNFEYLLNLNYLAQRSFNDLSQYPVFPWIIVDFDSENLDLNNPKIYRDLSKPIGALNPKRLEFFLKRYREFTGPDKFMYGTHYSTPGYVVGYKFRAFPLWMLHLQDGKFDLPDRLFLSVKQEWSHCYSQEGCVKELIPEFFMKDCSFLINKLGLSLGTTHDKVKVGDVLLPAWAKSASEFLSINSNALESEYVSDNLHNWIDLIFGYKQTGKDAIEADNVFLPSSYEGNINLDLIQEPFERRALRDQIKEYGQAPKQLFFTRHPRRGKKQASSEAEEIPDFREEISAVEPQPLERIKLSNLSLKMSLIPPSVNVTNCCFVARNPFLNQIFCFQTNFLFRVYEFHEFELKSTFKLSNSTVKDVVFMEPELFACTLGDKRILIFNTSHGVIVQTIDAHDGAVLKLCFQKLSVI